MCCYDFRMSHFFITVVMHCQLFLSFKYIHYFKSENSHGRAILMSNRACFLFYFGDYYFLFDIMYIYIYLYTSLPGTRSVCTSPHFSFSFNFMNIYIYIFTKNTIKMYFSFISKHFFKYLTLIERCMYICR